MNVKLSDPFFVGFFKKVPRGIAVFALSAGAAMVTVLLLAALVLPAGMADPGSGQYSDDLKGGLLKGVVDPLPYPILRVPAANGVPARAVLLGGASKIGVQGMLNATAALGVTAGGIFVKRGDLEMLLLGGGALRPAPEAAFAPAQPEPLGHWRLTGEICDGKCRAGAMNPGSGLAHKACANLCIDGGLPAVLVMALPVAGKTVVLLADADGGPMPVALLDLTAVPVEMTGQLERRDDLLIFRIDDGSVRAR
jgi:hypothetical protein